MAARRPLTNEVVTKVSPQATLTNTQIGDEYESHSHAVYKIPIPLLDAVAQRVDLIDNINLDVNMSCRNTCNRSWLLRSAGNTWRMAFECAAEIRGGLLLRYTAGAR